MTYSLTPHIASADALQGTPDMLLAQDALDVDGSAVTKAMKGKIITSSEIPFLS